VPDDKHCAYTLLDRRGEAHVDECAQVVAALTAVPASIAPKYFYDELGCAIYGAICQLPEYYPTRTEAALFEERRNDIAAAVGPGKQLVDLGAGDARKAEAWIPWLRPSRYVGVDIAAAELEHSLARLAHGFPELPMVGVVTDFTVGLPLQDALEARGATFFYPGSSIGNFTPAESVAFLARVQRFCAERPGSGLLIGVDGKKDKPRLDLAYDDPLGITAAFNRNVLRHLNRRFGFDFDVAAFAHRGFYEPSQGRIEMHLEALSPQHVTLGASGRTFARGERIHTESSYKYAPMEFEAVLREAGFVSLRRWDAASDAYYVFYAT